MRQLLNLCNEAQVREDVPLWYRSLYCLYKELDAKLNEKERERARELLEKVILEKNKKKTDSILPFVDLELFLRQAIESKGMLTKKYDATMAYRE